MTEEILTVLVSLVSGALGGNVSGAVAKRMSPGPLCNTVVGALAGIGAGQVARLFVGAGSFSQVGNAGMSAVVGALLPLAVGFVRSRRDRR